MDPKSIASASSATRAWEGKATVCGLGARVANRDLHKNLVTGSGAGQIRGRVAHIAPMAAPGGRHADGRPGRRGVTVPTPRAG